MISEINFVRPIKCFSYYRLTMIGFIYDLFFVRRLTNFLMNSYEIEIAFGSLINKIRSESGKGGKKKTN